MLGSRSEPRFLAGKPSILQAASFWDTDMKSPLGSTAQKPVDPYTIVDLYILSVDQYTE